MYQRYFGEFPIDAYAPMSILLRLNGETKTEERGGSRARAPGRKANSEAPYSSAAERSGTSRCQCAMEELSGSEGGGMNYFLMALVVQDAS
jgi:hypothetical protein